jgi:hypothetical protein
VIIATRLVPFVFSAVTMALARDILHSTYESSPCPWKSNILLILTWAAISMVYFLLSVPFFFFGILLKQRSSSYKLCVVMLEVCFLQLQAVCVGAAWITYSGLGCSDNTTPTINLMASGSIKVYNRCGNSESCGQLRSLAAVLSTAVFLWIVAAAVTMKRAFG